MDYLSEVLVMYDYIILIYKNKPSRNWAEAVSNVTHKKCVILTCGVRG